MSNSPDPANSHIPYWDLIADNHDMNSAFKELNAVISKPLHSPVAKFRASMCQLEFLARMPAVVMRSAMELAIQYTNAIHQLKGSRRYSLIEFEEYADDLEVTNIASTMMAEEGKTTMEQDYTRQVFSIGATAFSSLVASKQGELARGALDQIHQSLIIGAWAAFEDLACEVWCSLVNNAPKPVQENVWEAIVRNKFKKSDDSPCIADVLKTGVNPSTMLGTFLVEMDSVSFQRFGKINQAYTLTLGEMFNRFFDKNRHELIRALNASRNVFVHNGGIADPKFVADVGRFQEFTHIKVGQPLDFSGNQVKRLFTSAATVGSSLARLADAILQSGGIPPTWPPADETR